MAVYTLRYTSMCAGGEHVHFNILRDGVVIKEKMVTRTDFFNTETNFEEAMVYFMRAAIKAANAQTMAQARTAVEAAQWVV